MWPSVTCIVSVIQFNKQYNRSTERNMATLLAEKMFTYCNSSFLRQCSVSPTTLYSAVLVM